MNGSQHLKALWRRGLWRTLTGSGHWRSLWRRRLWRTLTWSRYRSLPTLIVAQSMRHTRLTLSHGAGSGAALSTHTVFGILPQGGCCCQLTHLDCCNLQLRLHGDPQLCRSLWRWLIGRGGLWLSVNSGLRHALHSIRNSLVWPSSDLSPCSSRSMETQWREKH